MKLKNPLTSGFFVAPVFQAAVQFRFRKWKRKMNESNLASGNPYFIRGTISLKVNNVEKKISQKFATRNTSTH
jgi:hypothetical protein